MPKSNRKVWDDEGGKYVTEDDVTRLKHKPYTVSHQREYVQTEACECCGADITVRGADKSQVDLAFVQLRRFTGGHNLCDACIAEDVRHYNLQERKALWRKFGRRS